MLNDEGAYNYKLNGNPKGASPKIGQRNVNQIIANLSQELVLLNYNNYPIKTEDRFQKRCTLYFRSHVKKRIIGGFVTLCTFKNRWITQKELLNCFPNFKKSYVSQVFKHCVLEGWFIAKPITPKVCCYKVCDMMLKSASEYYTFCSTSRNQFEFIY